MAKSSYNQGIILEYLINSKIADIFQLIHTNDGQFYAVSFEAAQTQVWDGKQESLSSFM